MQKSKDTSYKSLSDNDLIEKIKSGEASRYFEVLYNRYYQKVLDRSYSLLKNYDLARDITEEVFIKTYEKLPSFKQLSSFSSWIYSITYNRCIDYLREKKKLHYPEWNEQNEIPEIVDDSEESTENINYENLMVIMEEIHPEEKSLLLMKYQDNLSLKQISTAMRISEDAAKMRLKRARTRVLYLYTKKYLQR